MAIPKIAIAAGLVTLVLLVVVLTRPKVPTAAQLAEMTPEEVAAIKPDLLAKVDRAAIGALTPEQIGALTGEQIGALKPEQIEALTTEQIEALTSEKIDALTPEHIEALTKNTFNSVQEADSTRKEIFDRIDPIKLSALSLEQIYNLRSLRLSESHLSALKNASVVTALTATTFGALTVNIRNEIIKFLAESQVKTIDSGIVDALVFVSYLLGQYFYPTVEKVAWLDTSMITAGTCGHIRTYDEYPTNVKAAFIARCVAKNL